MMRSRLLPPLLLGALLVVTASCGIFSKDDVEKMRYLVEVERDPAPAPGNGRSLELRDFHVATAFANNGLVWRDEGGRYDSLFYEEWFVAPGSMLGSASRQWLERSGLFDSVRGGGGRERMTHVLEADCSKFFGDRGTTPPSAVIEVRITLLDAEDRVLLRKVYAEKAELTEDSEEALVDGMNRALTSVLQALETDLRNQLGG